MRKKVLTIAAVVLILGLICAAEQNLVTKLTDKALAETKQLTQHIRSGELDTAKEKTHALDEAWDRHAKKLEVLVDHRSTDDVRYALSKLLAALEGKDTAAALIYAGELEGGIEHVYERQALTMENIF
ncbi:MAG: DUF4363 family protein [Clostridia bacterium]|nr:DUF4363 family protein [Clostridia bacterium]